MIVTCEHCGARYKLDDSKLKGRGAKITCPRCRHVFIVYRGNRPPEEASDEAPDEGASAPGGGLAVGGPRVAAGAAVAVGTAGVKVGGPRPAAVAAVQARGAKPAGPQISIAPPPAPERPDVNTLDFRKVGVASWKVRVKIGLVYDFGDYKTLRRYITDGRVTDTDLLSYDGKSWTPIGDILDLERHFIDVYLALQEGKEPPKPGADDDDDDDGDENEASREARQLAVRLSSQPKPAAASAATVIVRDTGPAQVVIPTNAPPPPRVAARARGGGSAALAVNEELQAMLGEIKSSQPEFVDPFEALKNRQRQRIEARRQPVRRKKAAKSGGMWQLVAALGLLACALGLGWYMIFGPGAPNAQPSVKSAAQLEAERVAAEQRKKIEDAYQAHQEDMGRKVEHSKDPVLQDQELIPIDPTLAYEPSSDGELTEAEQHFNAGFKARKTNDNKTAVVEFQKAVELDPGQFKYHLNLGVALFSDGQVDAAEAPLKKALEVDRDQTVVYKWLGNVAEAQGNKAKAIENYQRYLLISPHDMSEIQAKIDQLSGG